MNDQKEKKVVFTKEDVGCYGDSARGIYMVDHVVEFAQTYGFVNKAACGCDGCQKEGNKPSDCEFSNETQDAAEEFLNSLTDDGLWWGSNDNGDWGLWEVDGE